MAVCWCVQSRGQGSRVRLTLHYIVKRLVSVKNKIQPIINPQTVDRSTEMMLCESGRSFVKSKLKNFKNLKILF